ncbi:MAG TPA: glycosyltransferase family 4 protein [Mycobacteriales bacterium]|nr:glycosyltransferase family 4 protein [Mycobacteriales bacterium]
MVDASGLGGAIRAYVDLPSGLDAADWSARHSRGEVPDSSPYGLHRMAHYGVEVVLRPPLDGRRLGRVARAVRSRSGGLELVEAAVDLRRRASRDADVVLCYDERTGVPAALLAGRPRPPVVTGIGWLTQRATTHRVLAAAARALPRAALVWAQCRPMLPILAEQWGVPVSRLRFVTFGIDADFYTPVDEPREPDLVVSAGEDRHRDHDLLVRAMQEVRRRRPGIRLEIATGLPIDLPGDLGRVYTGRLGGRMRNLYARSSLVAVALRPTPTGSGLSVVLEAMASERPVVVTANPGMEDYVRHGETGVLVPPGDVDAFAAAVEGLLADPDRAAAMGRAAAKAVRERFTTETMAEELAQVLREVS